MGGSELEETMYWSNDYWTSHGGGLDVATLKANNRLLGDVQNLFQMKPLYPAGARYGAPVKPVRAPQANLAIKGNLRGEVVVPPAERKVGTSTDNMFWFILHYYRVDGFMREAHPASAGTITHLQKGDHRYQRAKGSAGAKRGDGSAVDPADCEQLFGIFEKEVLDAGGKAVGQTASGDSRFLSQNVPFSICEWEDTNQANRQRSNRDDCMPLVIASPNNFPIPAERKIGAIIYQPAYATVVAAQNP